MSTIGRKVVIAITGLLLSGFLLAHMAGNLFIYLGPDAINSYAHHLKSLGPLLWVARFGLLILFLIHMGLAISLVQRSASARVEPYQYRDWRSATVPSRTMVLTGAMILAFVLYHIAHFTLGVVTNPAFDGRTHLEGVPHPVHDVYTMVVTSFQNPLVVTLYILSQVLVWMHLNHGVSSAFKTLGLYNKSYRKWVMALGSGFAFMIAVGNISIPVACLTEIIPLHPTVAKSDKQFPKSSSPTPVSSSVGGGS